MARKKHKVRRQKRDARAIFLSLIMILGLAFGAKATYEGYHNRLDYSLRANPGFKNRIQHALKFMKTNSPEQYALVRWNVHLIADQSRMSEKQKRYMKSSFRQRANDNIFEPNSGLIALKQSHTECPASLVGSTEETVNCASTILREAMHYYHAHNNLYQSDEDIEKLEAYQVQYDYLTQYGGSSEAIKNLESTMKSLRRAMRRKR